MEIPRTRSWLVMLCACFAVYGLAVAQETGPLATVKAAPEGLRWAPNRPDQSLTLSVSGPGTRLEREFPAGREPWLAVRDEKMGSLPDGTYRWELRAALELEPESREPMAEIREVTEDGRSVDRKEIEARLEGPSFQEGSFSVRDGKVVNPAVEERDAGPGRGRDGSLEVAGDLEVKGKKAFTVSDPSSGSSIVYVALEGPEAGTYFRGAARTVRGEAVIELPDHFAKVTETEGLTVQLTPLGAWSRLYVAEATPERLVVRDAGTQDAVTFNYLVQGVRKGYHGHQVERPADGDHD